MDKDILDYGWYGLKGLAYFGVGYPCLLYSIVYLNTKLPKNKEIESDEELANVVRQEAEKLGLDMSKINITRRRGGLTNVQICNNGEAIINFSEGCARRNIVKHELYHVFRDSNNQNHSLAKYFFVQEPRAIIYESFGLKL